MEINKNENKFYWIYKIGFFIILALPILTLPPYFAPPDWGKTIVFRSILAILLFLFIFQILFRKNELKIPIIKKNPIFWLLTALFIIFLLATIFSVDFYFSLWGSPYRGGGFVTFAFYFVFAVLAFILFKKPAQSPSPASNAFGVADAGWGNEAGGDDWEKAWIFSIFIGILVSLIGIIQYYGLFNRIFLSVPDRPPSTMGNPIMLAMYVLLLSFFTLSLAINESFGVAQDRQNRYLKIFYIFSLVIFLYTILITGSRAVYLGIAMGALYFFLFYPKKIRVVKIAIIILMILMIGIIFYANTVNQYPKFLQQNRLFKSVAPRLSINLFLTDPRFYAWTGIDYKILAGKPILGYGPENFAVGFDKYYDPSIPYLNESWGDWWDKAHNIFLDIGAQAGILGIIAYLALFVALFWQLRKAKRTELHRTEHGNTQIIMHGIQATLIGYLVGNFFSFDAFGTYLIFFLLIGYSLHLITQNNTQNGTQTNTDQNKTQKKNNLSKSVFIFVLFCILALFLWQYNFLPLQINAEINRANSLANHKRCDEAFGLMNKILPEHSFLDSYVRMEYVELTKTCISYYPENKLTYIKNGLKLINEALKIQPLYTRYWLYMGTATTALATQETNADAKNNLLKQASYYFDRALQLSPKHQEIPIEQAKMEIVAGNDYEKMKSYAEKCVALNPGFGDCYWYLALSEIYLKDTNDAQKNIQIASEKAHDINSKNSVSELSDAYISISDYQDLISIYEKLIAINPNVAQLHSSMAFLYKQLGQYDKARQEALKVLQLSPGSKPSVDAFLKTLPY